MWIGEIEDSEDFVYREEKERKERAKTNRQREKKRRKSQCATHLKKNAANIRKPWRKKKGEKKGPLGYFVSAKKKIPL